MLQHNIRRRFSPAQGETAYEVPVAKKQSWVKLVLRKLFPFLSLLSFFTFVNAQTPEQITLEQFLELAQSQCLAAKAATSDLRTAEWNYRLYRSVLKPQLTANANFPNYAKTFSETTQPDGTILFQPITNNNSAIGLLLSQNIPLTGGRLFVQSGLQRFDDFENDAKLFNGNPIQIGLIQPLWGFNALKWDRKIEPLKQKEAQKKYRAEMADISMTVSSLFFDLLVAHQEAEIANANEKNNEQLFGIAKERLQLGRLSEGDLKQLELQLISARQARQRAEQLAQQASGAILNFLGQPNQKKTLHPVFTETINSDSIDEEEALRQAWANRPDAITQQRLLLEADRNVNRAKREYGLNANLTASFGLVRSSKNLSDIYSDPQQQQFVQLQLDVPIIDWGARKAAVGAANTQRQFAEFSMEQQKRDFEMLVRQTTQDLNFLKEDLQSAKSIRQLALERFDIANQSYQLGAISVTELTLAQREKDQAQRAYTNALRDYWNSYFQLRSLTLWDF